VFKWVPFLFKEKKEKLCWFDNIFFKVICGNSISTHKVGASWTMEPAPPSVLTSPTQLSIMALHFRRQPHHWLGINGFQWCVDLSRLNNKQKWTDPKLSPQ
jgi:hypothetical protein